MEEIANSLYLILFIIATIGAMLLLSGGKPPWSWALDTENFDDRLVQLDPFHEDNPDLFVK